MSPAAFHSGQTGQPRNKSAESSQSLKVPKSSRRTYEQEEMQVYWFEAAAHTQKLKLKAQPPLQRSSSRIAWVNLPARIHGTANQSRQSRQLLKCRHTAHYQAVTRKHGVCWACTSSNARV